MILLRIIEWGLMVISLLVGLSFLTLFERKILSYIQYRKGPNKVGVIGILQPFADAVKLASKQTL
jgi:NADH:ubiquinone oxidoreductase subunit H